MATAGRFPATRHSLVQRAQAPEPTTARAALDELCTSYWPALYVFARRRGMTPADAEDLVQGLFASLLGAGALAGFDHERGRFRTYLLGALRHHEQKLATRAAARKRGGGVTPLGFDARVAEAALAAIPQHDSPEDAYARAWALGVLKGVEEALREDYRKRGAERVFEALVGQLAGRDTGRYAEVAEALGMREGAVKVAVHRLRKRYGEILRARIADTVAAASDVDAELRALLDAVRDPSSASTAAGSGRAL